MQLHRRKAWLRLLETWPNPQQQHDVAELLVYLKRQLRFPAMQGTWEACTMQGPHHRTHQCATQVPHLMLPCQPHKTLQELVEQWAYDQDTGRSTFNSQASTLEASELSEASYRSTAEREVVLSLVEAKASAVYASIASQAFELPLQSPRLGKERRKQHQYKNS